MYYGTIYWPVGYTEGHRYPLVIQTHGSDSVQFKPSGVSTTTFAAQPLAANGIIVVQGMSCVRGCSGEFKAAQTTQFQETTETLIADLVGRGIADSTKIGLQGYSVTGGTVLYFLTRSKYAIAAAIAANAYYGSFMQFISFAATDVAAGSSLERFYREVYPANRRAQGSADSGNWMTRRFGLELDSLPAFQIDRVKAPLLLSAGRDELLSMWEVFEALRIMDKPVEYVYLPDAEHNILKPSERMTSQQGAVDWFRFWLQGYEDPAPAKREQYARWRRLREQQRSNASQQ
jgi:dipeptidyl aminopeptidase/acylaminoacyl peptidase